MEIIRSLQQGLSYPVIGPTRIVLARQQGRVLGNQAEKAALTSLESESTIANSLSLLTAAESVQETPD